MTRRRLAGAAVVAVLAAAAVALASRADAPPAPAATRAPCAAVVDRGVLPAWARTGFSDPRPRIAHVVGRAGRIAAILFGDPLTSPPRRGTANKILWVARRPLSRPSDLHITARRFVAGRPAGRPASRVVTGAPGPSIVDLPAPGCWRLALRWAGRRDVVDVRYVARDA